MADTVYYLTSDDREVLERFLASESRRHRGSRNNGESAGDVDDQEFLPPEVYVARSPTGGIPALDSGVTAATYTGTGTGTGTNTLLDDVPGEAECYVWMVLRDDAGIPYLQPVAMHPLRVLNMSDKAVDGDKWVLVVRDKFGEWWVVTGAGGTLDVCGVPHQTDTGTGTGTNDLACPVEPTTPELIPAVEMLKFSEDFETTRIDEGECDDAGTGTGTAGTGRLTAHIKTRGYTGDVTFAVNPVWCASICDLVAQDVTFCIKNGRVTNVFFGAAPECPP